MTEQKLEYFKNKLEATKREVEEEIKKLETPPAYEDVPGPDDEADESTDYFNATSSTDVLHERIANIDHALTKITEGTYGICEATEKEIPEEVLEVNPEARFHPDYQKSQNTTE